MGLQVRDRIVLSPPDVGALEEEFLVRALRSGWAAPAGPDIDAFEQEVARRTGTAYAVAVSSGTAALHLALLALGIGPQHVVIVPTLTFAATANAVVYTGAEPIFADCDPHTGNVDPALVATLIVQLRREGRHIGAIIPVDLFGSCADYSTLTSICTGIPIIEDAAEALGATFRGAPAGSFGRVAALSFNGNKIITTSGGGMLVSDDAELISQCRYLATQARQPVVHYEHTDIGYNYRLSNLLAALGRAQLSRLDDMMSRRRALRSGYRQLLGDVPGVRFLAPNDAGSNCWLTTLAVDPHVAGWSAAELHAFLALQDIESRPMWKPMHQQPVFAGARSLLTGAADELFANGLALPSGSALGSGQISRVMDTIENFLESRR